MPLNDLGYAMRIMRRAPLFTAAVASTVALNLPDFGASVLNFLSRRAPTHTLEHLAAVGFNAVTLSGNGEPEQLSGNRISPALVRMLVSHPWRAGRFAGDEEKPGVAPVASARDCGSGAGARQCAAVALLIATIGVYGGMAYSVNRRTRDIGLRMALGARSGSVPRLIAGEGMTVVLAGIGIGLIGGLAWIGRSPAWFSVSHRRHRAPTPR
jgi:hypothetical protein